MKLDNVADVYVLSPMQEGILFHTIAAPASGVFFEQFVCTLHGVLDPDAFRAAWQDVVARHPVLRTALLWDGLDEPLQVVRETAEVPWTAADWRGVPPPLQQEQLDDYLARDRAQGFDLADAPLMRLALFRTAADAHRMVWSTHHALLDGWSLPLVFRDVLACYAARRQGTDPALPPVRPYRDYIAWLQQQDLGRAEAFWRDHLAGFDTPTPFRMDRPADDAGTAVHAHRQQSRTLSADATAALQDFARRHRLTLSTLVQGAWALLLSRYSGHDDVVFGTTVSGRPATLPGVEQMVGLFINTLPLRLRADAEARLVPWLQQVQRTQLDARAYEYTPLAAAQRWSDVPAGQPLFESIVVFENYPTDAAAAGQTDGLAVRDIAYHEQSNYPLALLAVPGAALQLIGVYDTARFEGAAIQRMLGHLETLLTGFTTGPHQPLRAVPTLTPREQQQVASWHAALPPTPRPACLHQLIEARARQAPDAAAILFEGRPYSYGMLETQANRLAHHLQHLGVGPGVRVAVCMTRAPEMVVAILATLKAGGAYVPLDPTYPAARRAYMLEDTGARVLLTQQALAETLPHRADVAHCYVDAEAAALDAYPATPPPCAAGPDDLAYVIYTSGSTGAPKGVMVTHGNIVHATLSRQGDYPEPPGCFLLLSSFAFDSAMVGLFWTLSGGGTLLLPPQRVEQDVQRLSGLIARHRVTHTLCLPTLYSLLLDLADAEALASLRVVIVAGEACPPDLPARHHAVLPEAALYNEYGPTEGTVWCSTYRLPPQPFQGPAPIGRPPAGTQVHLLDPHRQPVPVGVPGELYVGGAGVARGYLGRPALTAERFLDDPFSATPGARLYRTGDLARYREDGVVTFLGRADQQVKIRGYRIELGEIEAALRQTNGVQEAVVVARRDDAAAHGRLRLVAYLVADDGANGRLPDGAALRAALLEQLPDYMVPALYVPLTAVPRTPNGKVDHRALPAPTPDAAGRTETVAPRNAVEETLAGIWADVLGLPAVGVQDNFFELGGDSILSIQIISRAHQAGLALAPNQLFEHQTVAALAAVVGTAAPAAAEQGLITGAAPLTPVQHWFFEQRLAAAHHWNQYVLLEAAAPLRRAALAEALGHLTRHHDALRLRFAPRPGGLPQQHHTDPAPVPVHYEDLTDLPAAEQAQAVAATAEALHAGLNLTAGPILEAALFERGGGRPQQVLIVIHHLVVDAVSWPILLDDLAAAYRACSETQAVVLPPKTTSFKAWAEALAGYAQHDAQHEAQHEALRRELGHWRAAVEAARHPLPADHPAGENTVAAARTHTVALTTDETQALLQEVPAAYNTQINDVLLTALAQTLAPWTGRRTVGIELEGHGREQIVDGLDLSRTVGWFTTLFPVALHLPDGGDLGVALKAIKEQLRSVPRRGIGYGMLRYLAGDPAVTEALSVRPSVLFNYLGRPAAPRGDALFTPSQPLDAAHSPLQQRSHQLDINAAIVDRRLTVRWTYSAQRYHQATVEQHAAAYVQFLRDLIGHCLDPQAGGYTPFDFPEAGLDQDDLDRFINRIT